MQVKKQHTERGIAFLADELKVIDAAEASDRIFFVSAREALASRINQERGTPTPSECRYIVLYTDAVLFDCIDLKCLHGRKSDVVVWLLGSQLCFDE
jgi:hypothetical protein